MKPAVFSPAVFLAALLLSCGGAGAKEVNVMEPLSDADVSKGLETIAGRRIFFGHQSVGRNILEGLSEVSSSREAKPLRVVEARSSDKMDGSGLYHAEIGRNEDPLSKLSDFESLLREGVADSVDAALMKFCYVDITSDTDVDALFDSYKEAMSRLRSDFPRLVLVHVTAPLTSEESGPKAALKRMLGKRTSAEDNAAREEFNRKLRAEYRGKAPFFDLALAEASDENGTATLHASGKEGHYALRPEYTDDGGHLNPAGRRRAAEALAAELGAALH